MRLTPEWRERHWRRDQCRLIAQARKRAGLSRAELAARLAVSEDVVAQIESGSLLVDRESRDRAVEVCGFAIEWIQGFVRDRLRLKPLEEWDQERLDMARAVRARHGGAAADLPTATFLAACLRRARPAEAASLCERAIELGRSTPGADLAQLHMDLAEVLQLLGDLERAKHHAEEAIAIAGADNRRRYLYRYALILRDTGELTAARAAARELVETQEPDPEQPAWRNLELDVLLGRLDSSGPRPTE